MYTTVPAKLNKFHLPVNKPYFATTKLYDKFLINWTNVVINWTKFVINRMDMRKFFSVLLQFAWVYEISYFSYGDLLGSCTGLLSEYSCYRSCMGTNSMEYQAPL